MCVIIVMKSIGCDKLFVGGGVGFCCLIEVMRSVLINLIRTYGV